MECTDTSEPYQTPFLFPLDGQNDSNTGKGLAAEGTVASRVRSLNERDRKPQEAEKNVSQPKSVLSRAPPAIREANQSLSQNPQRLSPFVRRTADRLPTPASPVHALHANIPVHAPTPKFVIQRPTFFDISPGSDRAIHTAGQWQKPGSSYLSRNSNESSSPLPKNAAPGSEISGTIKPQRTDLPAQRKSLRPNEALPREITMGQGTQRDVTGSLTTTGQKQKTPADKTSPWGVTLRKSQPTLKLAHNKTSNADPAKPDASIETKLRTLRPISPSIGIGPRKTTFGRAGGTFQPASEDETGSSSAVECTSEGHVPGPVEEAQELEAAALAKRHDEGSDTKTSSIPLESTGSVDTANQFAGSSLRETSLQDPMPIEADTTPTSRQEQLDRIHAFDTVIKKQSNLLQGVILQLRSCGPRLEEIRTLSRGLSPRTTNVQFPASEPSDSRDEPGTLAATPKSDSSVGWEVYDAPDRTRTMSFPDALLALNDVAETVSSLVKDIQPVALSDIPRAQSPGGTTRRTQSLPETCLGLAAASLISPVKCPEDLLTPRPNTVHVQPHFDWLCRPSAASRFTLTPPPGHSMGKAMTHAALRNALPPMLHPTPQEEKPPVLRRKHRTSYKGSTHSKPPLTSKVGVGLPNLTTSSSSLSSRSSISQFSLKPTPPLYFSYQQLPAPAEPTSSNLVDLASFHGPPTSISATDQHGQPSFSSMDKQTPSSTSKDSPPPPPPKLMGFDPITASPTTGGSSNSKGQKAQSDCGMPIGSSMSSMGLPSPQCDCCKLVKDARMAIETAVGNKVPSVAALSPVEESPETSRQPSQESVPDPSNDQSRKDTSQSTVQTALRRPSPVVPPLTAQVRPTIPKVSESPVQSHARPNMRNEDHQCLHALADPSSPPSPPLTEFSDGNAGPEYGTATLSSSGPPPDATPASAIPPPNPKESIGSAQPSETDTTAVASPSTSLRSPPRRPFPVPLQIPQEQHEDGVDQRQQTKMRIEQWRRMVPAMHFASQPVGNLSKPHGGALSTASSSLPRAATEHLDVRTRVRLLEAARRAKELEMEEKACAAAASAAAVDVFREKQVRMQTADADAVGDAGARGEGGGAEALFKGGANEQIGALEKPFW